LLSVFAELDLPPLELELEPELELGGGGSSLEDNAGGGSSPEEYVGVSLLELLGFATFELDFGPSELNLGISSSSLSPQKTSNKLSLPSLHPKTASTRATTNKNTRIL